MKKIITLLLAVVMTVSLTNIRIIKADSATDQFSVHVTAKEMYKNAFEVLNLVNKERKEERKITCTRYGSKSFGNSNVTRI